MSLSKALEWRRSVQRPRQLFLLTLIPAPLPWLVALLQFFFFFCWFLCFIYFSAISSFIPLAPSFRFRFLTAKQRGGWKLLFALSIFLL
jgi:hypothetical protein